MQDFIDKFEKLRDSDIKEERNSFDFMKKAYHFAKRHRALGIGVIGWHSYLQSKMIAFEDIKAYELNKEIFKFIKEKSYTASQEMAKEYGEPEVLKGYGRKKYDTFGSRAYKFISIYFGIGFSKYRTLVVKLLCKRFSKNQNNY